jgi:hypothetical protein
MHIQNRRIFLNERHKSQTVSVCTLDNRQGDYEHVFRLIGQPYVSPSEVGARPTLDDLEAWLLQRGFRDEGPRPGMGNGERAAGAVTRRAAVGVTRVAAPNVAGIPAAMLGAPWLATATRVVEVAIDALVWEFVEHPYLHRVEHSLHARLISILAAHPLFSHLLPIGDTGRYTQPVHKEWPETIGRAEKDGRRGSFDLAILSRDQLAAATLEEFRQGRIAASIVIEIGLDYGLDHLRNDHDKLVNSEVEAGFLIHFSRAKPRDLATEEYLLSTKRAHRTAYAHHDSTGICTFKNLDGATLQTGP